MRIARAKCDRRVDCRFNISAIVQPRDVHNTGNLNFLSGSLVTIGAVTFTDANNYAGVINAGSAPVFTGPSTDRVYTGNGFDCILDVAAGTCDPL